MKKSINLKDFWGTKEPFNLSKVPVISRDVLHHQIDDSIRRIKIYDFYRNQSNKISSANIDRAQYNPLALACANRLDLKTRIWIAYVATYFGKSNKSGWDLVRFALFPSGNLVTYDNLLSETEDYLTQFESLNPFKNTAYSNHRKYTAKSVRGNKGFAKSIFSFIDFVERTNLENDMQQFDTIYKESKSIANFGRMACFDFSCILCKIGLNITQPDNLYLENSTGPLSAFKYLEKITDPESSCTRKQLITNANHLLDIFTSTTGVYMSAQVLEDAMCNWQKNPFKYIRYTG